jgi:hypothetical protein
MRIAQSCRWCTYSFYENVVKFFIFVFGKGALEAAGKLSDNSLLNFMVGSTELIEVLI